MHSSNGVHGTGRKLSMTYISSGYMDAESFTTLCKNLSWINADISASSANTEVLDDSESAFTETLDDVRKADLLILRMHCGSAYFRKYDRLIDIASRRGVPTIVSSGSTDEIESRFSRSLFPFSDEEYRQLHDFIEIGGERNLTGAVIWACRKFCGLDLGVPEADVPRAQGIYRPGAPAGFRESAYLSSLDWSKPTVAVMFSQSLWIRGATKHIDRLVGAIESRGANAIPIFFTPSYNKSIGSLGIRGTVRKYLMRGHLPKVGAIVMCMGFSQKSLSKEDENGMSVFEEVGVPVLQAPTVYRSIRGWEEDPQGLDAGDLSMSVIQTEFDGQILAPPLAFTESRMGRFSIETVPDRVSAIADSALAWCRLGSLPRDRVHVAIVLSAPSMGRIGAARGLDTMQSLVSVLERMSREGYYVPNVPGTSDEMADMLGMSLDDGYAGRCVDRIGPGRYNIWYDELPNSIRFDLNKDRWPFGSGAGDRDDSIPIRGILDGNVFIGVQPHAHGERGSAITHEYLAFYRWIEDVFQADAIISFGSGDGPEGLDGKECALSSDCLPDIVLRTAVHIQPYAIDDPAGALRSKRRAHSVTLAYMVPASSRAGSYGDTAELKAMIQEELMAGEPKFNNPDRLERIRELMAGLSLWSEVGMDGSETDLQLREGLPYIFSHITELEDEMIEDRLHVLGSPPEERNLAETVFEVVRYPNGCVPSIMEVLPDGAGESEARDLIERFSSTGFDAYACSREAGGKDASPGMRMLTKFICGTIVPSLRMCGREIDNMMSALRGGFIPPGPGGSPFMGNAHLLPSGRNIFGPNPLRLPDEVGWEHGSELADEIVTRFVEENGRYPTRVVMVMHASDVVMSGGSEIACVLRLMGLKPVWGTRGGSLTGTEVTPLSELGRPRVDVRIACSSLFTGNFPDAMRLIENGSAKVSLLNEEDESEMHRRCLAESITSSICESVYDAESIGNMAGLRMGSGGTDLVIGCSTALVHDEEERETMMNAIRSSGDQARVYIFSKRPNGTPRVRSAEEELVFTMRTKVLNPKWIQGMMKHGYSGAAAISAMMSCLQSWETNGGWTRPWMYRGIVETYIQDARVHEWMASSNPYALMETLEGLIKSADEGFWNPTSEERNLLMDAYLDAEGTLEGSHRRG